jgi:hypothetical protein
MGGSISPHEIAYKARCFSLLVFHYLFLYLLIIKIAQMGRRCPPLLPLSETFESQLDVHNFPAFTNTTYNSA